MDWIHAHLVVNHFPIVLSGLASLAAPIAFLTGQRAEEVAESLPGLAEEAIETHEHWGLYALVALGIWAATAVAGGTAFYGGEIEHPKEARTEVDR
jgi:hypothetical protein